MTDEPNYDNYEPIDDTATAADVEAMKLSFDELKLHFDEGELNHLSRAELLELTASAQSRDMQATIVR